MTSNDAGSHRVQPWGFGPLLGSSSISSLACPSSIMPSRGARVATGSLLISAKGELASDLSVRDRVRSCLVFGRRLISANDGPREMKFAARLFGGQAETSRHLRRLSQTPKVPIRSAIEIRAGWGCLQVASVHQLQLERDSAWAAPTQLVMSRIACYHYRPLIPNGATPVMQQGHRGAWRRSLALVSLFWLRKRRGAQQLGTHWHRPALAPLKRRLLSKTWLGDYATRTRKPANISRPPPPHRRAPPFELI